MITIKYLLLVGMTSTLLSYLMTPLIKRLAPALGMIDLPNHRKIHQKPIPRGGGIAIFLAFHTALVVLYYWPLPPLKGYLNGIWWWHFFLLSSCLVVVGVLDDIFNLRARTKLMAQTAVAIGAYASGIHFGALMGMKFHYIVDLILTVFWLLAIINAFNLIDGMDGLASGLAIIGGLGLAGTLFVEHLNRDLVVIVALVGACLGFLRYNFHPATIFLGDSGSMFLGFTLGTIALSTGSKDTAVTSLVVPALAVGIPLFDTSLAVWRRIARRLSGLGIEGQPAATGVMAADAEHLHHRLLKNGLSHQKVAVMLYGAAIVLVVIGLMSLLWQSCAVGIYTLAFVAATYVVVRHIAHAELWASSTALLNGLTRPSRKSLMVVVRIPLDLLLAIVSFGVTRWLLFPGTSYIGDELLALTQSIIWIAFPFLTLILFRIYDRAWSLASLMDFFILGLATLTGILVSTGVTLVITTLTFREILPEAVLYTGLLGTAWNLSRALPRLLEEGLAVLQRWYGLHLPDRTKVILVGAGHQCSSILRNEMFIAGGTRLAKTVVGIVDDDSNLLDRYVHGNRIIGLVSQLGDLISARGIHELIITRPLGSDLEREVLRIARESGVRVYRWQADLHELDTSAT